MLEIVGKAGFLITRLCARRFDNCMANREIPQLVIGEEGCFYREVKCTSYLCRQHELEIPSSSSVDPLGSTAQDAISMCISVSSLHASFSYSLE